MLLGLGHHLDADVEMLVHQIGLAAQRVVVLRTHRAGEAADQFPVAVDLLRLDEAGEIEPRLHALLVDPLGALQAVGLHHAGESELQIAAGDTAIAARRSFAGAVLFQHHDIAPGPRQGQRRAQSREAGPDDHHVRRLRQRGVFRFGTRRVLPPIGIRIHRCGHDDVPPNSCELAMFAVGRQMGQRRTPR